MQGYIFSVVTNQSQYDACVKNNPFLKNFSISHVVNTHQNNISIATHYNRFIEQFLSSHQEDNWLIFCHQDFEFLEDPTPIVNMLNTHAVYGPIGMAQVIKKYPLFGNMIRGRAYGRVISGPYIVGETISKPTQVDTLDCCCLIVHSSLLRQYPLRFDELFDFHLYAEDFCLAAHHLGIQSNALQIQCNHHSNGTLSKSFFEKYKFLVDKYPNDFFLTMCVHLRFSKNIYLPTYHTVWFYNLLIKIVLYYRTRKIKKTSF